MADAEPEHVEAWEKRDEERNWRIVDAVVEIASETGKSPSQVALNWLLTRPVVAAPIVGARTVEQLEDNLGAVGWSLTAQDERQIDALVPRGEHTGKGYNDPQYPVRGRVLA